MNGGKFVRLLGWMIPLGRIAEKSDDLSCRDRMVNKG
jgi:hypothetical protein